MWGLSYPEAGLNGSIRPNIEEISWNGNLVDGTAAWYAAMAAHEVALIRTSHTGDAVLDAASMAAIDSRSYATKESFYRVWWAVVRLRLAFKDAATVVINGP